MFIHFRLKHSCYRSILVLALCIAVAVGWVGHPMHAVAKSTPVKAQEDYLVPVTKVEIPDAITGRLCCISPTPYLIIGYSDGMGLVIDYKTSKRGYIDESGKPVIPMQFRHSSFFSEGLAAATVDDEVNLFGYIDKTGKFVIKPQFPLALDYREGLAAVKVIPPNIKIKDETGKTTPSGANAISWAPWGFIDRTGKFISDLRFHNVSSFSHGLAAVQPEENSDWGYIDKTGQFVIKPCFDSANDFSESLALVCVHNKYGFINKTGNFAITPRFDWASDFSEGLAAVKINDKFGYIDKAGRIVIQPCFSEVERFHGGKATVVKDGLLGMIDHTGRFRPDVVPDRYSNNIHSDKKKVGFIDSRTGNLVITPIYSEARAFSEGLASIRAYEYPWKWGFIDRTGKTIIKPQFDRAGDFRGGHAEVVLDGKLWSIDKYGHLKFKRKLASQPSGLSPAEQKQAELLLLGLKDILHNRRSSKYIAVDFSRVSITQAQRRYILDGLKDLAPDVYDYKTIKNDRDKLYFDDAGVLMAARYGNILDLEIESWTDDRVLFSAGSYGDWFNGGTSWYEATQTNGDWKLKILRQSVT